jgi:hypothetical protein
MTAAQGGQTTARTASRAVTGESTAIVPTAAAAPAAAGSRTPY